MTLSIDIHDETNEVTSEDKKVLMALLQEAARSESFVDDAEVSITFVDIETIQQINKQYRGKDKPTDVISFALEELGEGEVELDLIQSQRVLGDIIISVPIAEQQAKEYGHSFLRELGFLTVHGFLHLLGYDHMTEEDEKVMFKKQADILLGYGLTR
ncbi:rRNA maturation RNase YbeY [Bacillus sp. HMF5848]|uniref:rRNA maturation RNase YbeY n=1 Tax=Bacillus sp. HMF5848 TaxID=2495421 RepID=UPI000F7A3D46|nr:rRNA maturation RNase YbeY [Bacillus sp. HMF5848]RSK27887.1 rRNA maturation RNase YbeY [Bacillus sp. HMF5848]